MKCINIHTSLITFFILTTTNTLICQDQDSKTAMSCNGMSEICDLPYDRVTYAYSHNATSNKPARWGFKINDQDVPFEQQLKDGIRAAKVPVYYQFDNIYACHGLGKKAKAEIKKNYYDPIIQKLPNWAKKSIQSAGKKGDAVIKLLLPGETGKLFKLALDVEFNPQKVPPCSVDPAAIRLVELFKSIAKFIKKNPNEIFTLFLEDYSKKFNLIEKDLKNSGLMPYLHRQDINQPWPTLKEMINSNKRVVLFINSPKPTDQPWLHHDSEFTWTTNWDYPTVKKLLNDKGSFRKNNAYSNRNKGNRMWLLFHFVTPNTAGDKKAAAKVNTKKAMWPRLEHYIKKADDRLPSFIAIDFYQEPNKDIFDIVKELNKKQVRVWKNKKIQDQISEKIKPKLTEQELKNLSRK